MEIKTKNTLLAVLALTLMLPVTLVSGCKSSSEKTPTGQVPVNYVFLTQPGGAVAGAAFTQQPVVSVVDASGNVVLGYNWMVMVIITPDTGVSGAKLSGMRMAYAVDGIATFTDLSIDTIGTGYSLIVTDDSALSTPSAPFNVAAASSATGN